MEENLDIENIMRVWKDYTTKGAIVVTEKAVKTNKPNTRNSGWRKLCPDVVNDFTGFMTGCQSRKSWNCGYCKKGGG